VGEKTKVERRIVLERALRDLVKSGMKLRRIENMKEKHVRRILDSWRSRELRASTMAIYVSHLRTLCGWLNNPGLINAIDRYVMIDPSMTRRRLVTNRDRSEQAVGITREEILRLAMKVDERFACQLRLVMAFGLRSQEAWLLRPHLAEGEGGTVCIRWGTKNGRPRTLPPMTIEQRTALDEAKKFAVSVSESTIPRGWTLQRWRHHYYWLLRKLGLTRAKAGVTPHSLRHGVLLRHYEAVAGVSAPARGGDLRSRDPFADRAARDEVAEFAGHRRRSIASVYIGSAASSAVSSTRQLPLSLGSDTPDSSASQGGPSDNLEGKDVTRD
jgi:integrase